jgi:hypothetical protein
VDFTSPLGTRRIRPTAALATALALGLVFASPARADFDLTNTWLINFRDGGGGLIAQCEWDFVQTGTDLTAQGSCGPSAFALLGGTIDPVSGVFALEGTILVIGIGYGPIAMSGAAAPDGRTLSGSHDLLPGGIFDAGLCGNGELDPGESCDEGTNSPGCCTDTCDFKPDGVACTTSPCQTATTCSSGGCVGTPKPAGTSCDIDANPCTKDSCDDAGGCDAGPCSPCCGGAGCSAAPRACKASIDQSSSILVKSTATGGANRLRFKIAHGDATDPADVGDPTTTSDYQLCVYTIGSVEQPVFYFDAAAPAGASWSRTRKGGALYRRPDRAPDGLASIRIDPGADGEAKVKVTGRGPALEVPFPVGPVPGGELTVQLGHAGACWGASFLLNSVGGNGPFLLKANRSFD